MAANNSGFISGMFSTYYGLICFIVSIKLLFFFNLLIIDQLCFWINKYY